MANSSGVGSPASTQDGRQPAECPPDNALPENSQESLDARLDHGIEETFPTSDPVSVHITKGPEPDRPSHEARSSSWDDQEGRPERDTAERLLDQVREALAEATDSISGAAGEVYRRGGEYARQARAQYPEAERYVREGQQVVARRVTDNPLLALFMAGVAGYALAWMIHGERRDRERHVPDHGRTSRGYAPHRER
jgi:hypothetical protein